MSTPDAKTSLAAMASPVRRLPARPQPAPAPDPEPPAAAEPKKRAPRSPARKPGRPATGRTSKGIGVPIPLIEPMDTDAAKTGLSRGDWLMAALNEVWDELPKAFPPLPKVRPELPPPRRPPRREVPGGRRSINFRLTDADTAAIDARRETLQVESRSEFVSMVLELKLKPKKARRPG